MSFNVRRVTHGPKHHMFGFHDLVQTNKSEDLLLALELDTINRPPSPGEFCSAGIVDLETGEFHKLHDTHTWNYPQGARQQWIGTTDNCVCNDRLKTGQLCSRVFNARRCLELDVLPFPVHCMSSDGTTAFWINYDRLHAVGGYGYVPFSGTSRRIDDLPSKDGLWRADVNSHAAHLIASIQDVAACGESRPVKTGYPHYITHPMLNPSSTRIAFLHQYRVVDGGDISRMITCDPDGGNMRCLAKGLVSHFTWVDDKTLFAWGADESSICKIRESPWLRVPGLFEVAMLAKRAVQVARRLGDSGRNPYVSGRTRVPSRSFMLLSDDENSTIVKTGIGILVEDGHPAARPGDYKTIICDTYPDEKGDRQLFLYDVDTEERQEIGVFRRVFETPNINTFDWRATQTGVDPRIIKAFDREHYMFARSGLHCDLHPRWSCGGNIAYFDSIHEGSRQLYAVDYSC